MKKVTKNILLAVTLSALGFTIAACNGGSTGVSASTVQNNVLPNGNFILPNGAQASLASPYSLVQPGKVTSTTLSIAGGNSSINYELNATAYSVKNGVYTPTNLVTASFSNSNVTTGSTIPSTTQVFVDATKAPLGFYVIAINSNDAANQNLQNSQQLSSLSLSAESIPFQKASYVQLDATGSLSAITTGGYSVSNVIVFAFANLSSPVANPAYLTAMQNAIKSEGLGTVNVLSIGGQTATPATINSNTVPFIVSTVDAQIKAYNAQLPSNGQIKGVDLDLENGIDGTTIAALAQKFNALGYVVSVAPQIINTSGTNVDPTNPTNLGLSSGGMNNQYQDAIASGNVAYIMVQTYNSGGWTINGIDEGNVTFFSAVATALNNTVKPNCTGAISLCIPATTQILIGEPSNAGAAGNSANIFGVWGAPYSYNQASILDQLNSQISTVAQSNYPNITGVMQWSLNNDYSPNSAPWSDNSAIAGTFSSTIFSATPTPPTPALPYFILQVSNSGTSKFASATLVINGNYYIFGNGANIPLAPGSNQLWGSLPSQQANPNIVDSSIIDTLFSSGSSFKASQININSYANKSSPIGSPSVIYPCNVGKDYTFQAGHSYNVLVNADYASCDIKMVN